MQLMPGEIVLTEPQPCTLGGEEAELLFMRKRYEENTRSANLVAVRPDIRSNRNITDNATIGVEPFISRPFVRRSFESY